MEERREDTLRAEIGALQARLTLLRNELNRIEDERYRQFIKERAEALRADPYVRKLWDGA